MGSCMTCFLTNYEFFTQVDRSDIEHQKLQVLTEEAKKVVLTTHRVSSTERNVDREHDKSVGFPFT